MFKKIKFLLVLFVVAAISLSAYAFAAANTVPDTKAGDGSGTVSGYNVTSVV